MYMRANSTAPLAAFRLVTSSSVNTSGQTDCSPLNRGVGVGWDIVGGALKYEMASPSTQGVPTTMWNAPGTRVGMRVPLMMSMTSSNCLGEEVFSSPWISSMTNVPVGCMPTRAPDV